MVEGHKHSAKIARLPKIGFLLDTDEASFGFLDPLLIVWGCHLVPVFANGRTSELLTTPRSLGRAVGEVDDWEAYYVMMCVPFWFLPAMEVKQCPGSLIATCTCAT
jgi:hypothetical protein